VQDAAGEGQVVADFEPLPTPLNAAALGHVLQLAAQDPGLIGASIEFVPAEPAPPAAAGGLPRERLARLLAIALTSDPATNPGGLF
jgi:hypothetical protein